jgi:hypothetical protein
VKYQIDISVDSGKTWKPIVKDWTITRRGHEPGDFWSQSFCWGSTELADRTPSPVQVRFHNDGGKAYARCEVHLTYETGRSDAANVTFAWSDDHGAHQQAHQFEGGPGRSVPWKLATGRKVQTRWVELEALPKRP